MAQFNEKIALVTGSGRGIGRAIALRLASEGANVVVNFFRNRKPAEETAAAIRDLGREAVVVKANVGDVDDLARLFHETQEAFGHLDILVHNAASGYNRHTLQQRPKAWDWTMNINARSLLFAAQHAVPLMSGDEGGVIVAITSLGSRRVLPDYSVVGASKAALEAIVRYLAVELAPRNIVVNAISPGLVVTDALQHFALMEEDGKRLIKEVEAKTPVGRLCMPEDVAEWVCVLSSPSASMLRGQIIILDGGYSLLANL
jgi:enoyl-[acyl-carrier protein] reductase III